MNYHSFGDFIFPIPDEKMQDLNWKLRYGGEISEGERMSIASVLSAYAALVNEPGKTSTMVMRELRKASKQL